MTTVNIVVDRSLQSLSWTQSRDRLRQSIVDEIGSLQASIRALKSRRNELAPVSHLPFELLAAIFSFVSIFAWNERSGPLALICIAHVCRRWRETALNHPCFWSRINLTKLTPVGMVEILSRAKMGPLHLEAADPHKWTTGHFEVLERQLETHIFHTRRLTFSGRRLPAFINRLVSPTSILEYLSLSHTPSQLAHVIIPDNLFNCTAPSLTTLKLVRCDIGWKSSLLKGLRILEIFDPSTNARPELDDWLDALNEMPQLKELSLRSATPVAMLVDPPISRTVILPSLTYFYIASSAKDCTLALAHLVLPTLTRLRVEVESHDWDGEDVLQVIPYVIRNVICVLQDIEPIRSILIAGERRCAEVLTWTAPGTGPKVRVPNTVDDMSSSTCFLFAANCHHWDYGVDIAVFDALLPHLPMNSVSTLTAQNCTRLSKEFWLSHAPRWPLLEQARLVSRAVGGFCEMLSEDLPLDSDGPRLPMLTTLVLLGVRLSAMRTFYLRDILIERVEQGVPLEHLGLRTCEAANRAIQLLAEIVVDVQEPLDASTMAIKKSYSWIRGIGSGDIVEFDIGQGPWHGDTDDSEGEDEGYSEDEDGDVC